MRLEKKTQIKKIREKWGKTEGNLSLCPQEEKLMGLWLAHNFVCQSDVYCLSWPDFTNSRVNFFFSFNICASGHLSYSCMYSVANS